MDRYGNLRKYVNPGHRRGRLSKHHSEATKQRISLTEKSKNLTGAKSHKWKGGRVITGYGYVQLMEKNHPRANCEGHVFEHILVMEYQPIVSSSLSESTFNVTA